MFWKFMETPLTAKYNWRGSDYTIKGALWEALNFHKLFFWGLSTFFKVIKRQKGEVSATYHFSYINSLFWYIWRYNPLYNQWFLYYLVLSRNLPFSVLLLFLYYSIAEVTILCKPKLCGSQKYGRNWTSTAESQLSWEISIPYAPLRASRDGRIKILPALCVAPTCSH